MAINLRSPYYIGTSIATTAYATLDISIWQGSSATPVAAQYNLSKNVLAGSIDVFFEISELVRDYLEITFDGDYTSQVVWVKTVQTVFNAANTVLATIPITQFAFDSYSYFEEPTFNVEINPLLISNRTIFCLADNYVRIPIQTKNNPDVTFLKNGDIVSSFSFTESLLTSEKIKYVTVNGMVNFSSYADRVFTDGGILETSQCLTDFFNEFEVGEADEVLITNNLGLVQKVIIKNLNECKYEPKKFTFVNKFGALQDIYFFKKQVNKMNVTKESYNANVLNSFGQYNISNHTKRDFNIKAKESFTFSSGYLNEEYNEVFKQMMLSEKVFITNITETEEQVLPINIITSNITFKTSLNDRLVEYTIEFENSYNVLNDIR